MSDENEKIPGSSNDSTVQNESLSPGWPTNIGGETRDLGPGSFGGMTPSTRPTNFAGATAQHDVVFSGADTLAFIVPKADSSEPYIPLRNLGAISYSIHRDKVPVRSLGTPRAKGYTLGTRTIAGSIVIINFDRAAFSELVYRQDYYNDSIQVNLYDEIPPFDLILTFQNENTGKMFSGGLEFSTNEDGIIVPEVPKQYSAFTLKNIRLIDEGMVSGVDEAYLETTFQYVAEDVEYLKPITIQTSNE